MVLLGILFALTALVSWGFGDFFIQRATREIGIWRALFFICLVGVIVIFPFIKDEIKTTLSDQRGMFFLTSAGVAMFLAALCLFRSYKEGKLAIVEPILTLELPITVFLGIYAWNEKLKVVEIALIGVVFLGVVLAMTKHHTHLHYHRRIFEKGVLWALGGAGVMGLTNFLMGASSQETSPLFAVWYTSLMILVFCFIYLLIKGELKKLKSDLKNHLKAIVTESIFDNLAWISFSAATVYIPISIATTITESYIVIPVTLGILINREKLERHQKIGITLAVLGVILLGGVIS